MGSVSSSSTVRLLRVRGAPGWLRTSDGRFLIVGNRLGRNWESDSDVRRPGHAARQTSWAVSANVDAPTFSNDHTAIESLGFNQTKGGRYPFPTAAAAFAALRTALYGAQP